jgi:hypothetical protein
LFVSLVICSSDVAAATAHRETLPEPGIEVTYMTDDTDAVSIQPHGRYVVARLSGQLSTQTVAGTRRALVHLLRQSGVAADLADLRVQDPGCVSVFSAALQQAGGWPHAKLAVFGADPMMLARLRCLRDHIAVPVADGLPAALAAAARPPDPAWRSGTIAASDPRAGVVDATAVSDEQELSHILDGAGKCEGLVRFIRDWLGPLLDYDVEHRSDLVTTLSVYLDRGGDYGSGARVLGIHRSTLRYRVQRIRELAGLDLGDACIWLNLHAATRALARVVGPPDHAPS